MPLPPDGAKALLATAVTMIVDAIRAPGERKHAERRRRVFEAREAAARDATCMLVARFPLGLLDDRSRTIDRLRPILMREPRRETLVLAIENRRSVLVYRVATGGRHNVKVDPLVIGPLLERNHAKRWAAAHSHPSGDATPSQNDRRVLQGLREIARAANAPLVDWLSVSETGAYSLVREREYAPRSRETVHGWASLSRRGS